MNIIVTGASRGIGYELVRHLCRDVKNNILAISRNSAKLKILKNETAGNPAAINILPYDLNKIDPHNFHSDHISEYFQEVDVLVNNAGVLVTKPFADLSGQDFELLFQTNVGAPARLIQALLGHFSSDAHVVNISSMGGYQGSVKFPGLSFYSASKGALAILTECLAEEFKGSGVKFNCLALGAAQTEMLEEAFPGYEAPVDAADMASFIAEFALTGSRFFNGKVIPVAVSTP